MPSHYSITEPHPNPGAYVQSGRGGAGNIIKTPKTSNGCNARGPASLFGGEIPQTDGKFVVSGRGGAGNVQVGSEKQRYSIGEELERQNSQEEKLKKEAVHFGRGGAGNLANHRKGSSNSVDSNGSDKVPFFRR